MHSDNEFKNIPFEVWAREGIRDSAREYCDYVVKMTAAIQAAQTPADAVVLISEMLETGRRYPVLDRWVEVLPEVTGRRVRYKGEGDSLVISIEDIPPDGCDPDEIPF